MHDRVSIAIQGRQYYGFHWIVPFTVPPYILKETTQKAFGDLPMGRSQLACRFGKKLRLGSHSCGRRQPGRTALSSRHSRTADCLASLWRSQNWRRNAEQSKGISARSDSIGLSNARPEWTRCRSRNPGLVSGYPNSDGDGPHVQSIGRCCSSRRYSWHLREIGYRIDRRGCADLVAGRHLFSSMHAGQWWVSSDFNLSVYSS